MAMESVQRGDSQVSHVAKNMPKFSGTTVHCSFLRERSDSWQLHLQRISPFLISGEGVWWKHVEGGFTFLDGDNSGLQNDGVDLLHFSVEDVEKRRQRCWKRIIEEKMLLM